jgi:hypothetical protein
MHLKACLLYLEASQTPCGVYGADVTAVSDGFTVWVYLWLYLWLYFMAFMGLMSLLCLMALLYGFTDGFTYGFTLWRLWG